MCARERERERERERGYTRCVWVSGCVHGCTCVQERERERTLGCKEGVLGDLGMKTKKVPLYCFFFFHMKVFIFLGGCRHEIYQII